MILIFENSLQNYLYMIKDIQLYIFVLHLILMILYQHFFFTAKIMENRNKTIVVKFGTSTLTQGSPKLNRPHMVDIVRQLAQLHQAGFRLVIVTSGAIAAGRHYLNHPQLPPTVASKQILAAVGQSQLICFMLVIVR